MEATSAERQIVRGFVEDVQSGVRGWINYYGSFYKSALYPTLRHLNGTLVRWAMRKFKRLRRHRTRAEYWLGRIARKEPRLFPHWQMGVRPAAG